MYRERLWPSTWVWMLAFGVVGMLAWAMGFALGPTWGLAILALGAGVVVAAVSATVPTIAVTTTDLIAGSARLPRTAIADVEVLDSQEMTEAVRRVSSPSYLMVRPWATRGGVRVILDDPDDPHAQWLISSRHPDRVQGCVGRRAGHGTLADGGEF